LIDKVASGTGRDFSIKSSEQNAAMRALMEMEQNNQDSVAG
jgi:hypothetical protein